MYDELLFVLYSINELLCFKMGQPGNALGLVEMIWSVCVVGNAHSFLPIPLNLFSNNEGQLMVRTCNLDELRLSIMYIQFGQI